MLDSPLNFGTWFEFIPVLINTNAGTPLPHFLLIRTAPPLKRGIVCGHGVFLLWFVTLLLRKTTRKRLQLRHESVKITLIFRNKIIKSAVHGCGIVIEFCPNLVKSRSLSR